jgi:hypothetical protein
MPSNDALIDHFNSDEWSRPSPFNKEEDACSTTVPSMHRSARRSAASEDLYQMHDIPYPFCTSPAAGCISATIPSSINLPKWLHQIPQGDIALFTRRTSL